MTAAIPAHVPSELVHDFDFFDLAGDKDIYEHYHKLHAGPDIFYTPRHGGHWVLTRYEDVAHVFENDLDFSSRHASIPFTPIKVTLMENDGALHRDFRKLLQPYFSPKAIGNLEKVATELTTSLIDGFIDEGECEFMQDFALRMPITIVMNLCELPQEDVPYLSHIADDITRGGNGATQEAAFTRLGEYLATNIIPQRTANPGKDMFSAIIHGKVDGGRAPTQLELLGLCTLLIVGGLDTVASMLGFIAAFLARNPGHRRQLIDNPALIPQAMEEMFRRFAVPNVGRIVARDMVYKGLQFKEGDFIMTSTTLAGTDDSHYPDAMNVDFMRANRKHVTFGRGPHQCIGSFLARTEIRVFLQQWLTRIPDFNIKSGEEPVLIPGKANRITYLPLTWKST